MSVNLLARRRAVKRSLLSDSCCAAEAATSSTCHHAAQKVFALARVFGNIPEDLFSRSDEQAIFRAVAKAGLGPKLLVRRFG